MNTIALAEHEHWNKHGYLLLKQHLSLGDCLNLGRWVSELAQWPETPGKWMRWYEGEGAQRQLCRLEDFLPYHAGLSSFLEGAAIAELLEGLMGEPAIVFKEKINFKLPGGDGFAPHQDAPAFTAFAQRYHVTLMIAVDSATRANGCLELVEGHHGGGLLPCNPDGTLDAEWSARQTWKPVEMSPGDVLVFDSFLPHRSGKNHTSAPRRALYVTYNRASEGSRRAEYFRNKREVFPPECERVAGADYSGAAATYNLGNPIL